eukprot:499571_1
MIALFISKLHLLTEDLVLHQKLNLLSDPKVESIINVIAKIVVLSIFAILSSQIQMNLHAVTTFIRSQTKGGPELFEHKSIVIAIIYDSWALNNLINILCIYLSFDFNINQYYQCCACLHHCWMKCCQLYTKKRLEKRGLLIHNQNNGNNAIASIDDHGTSLLTNCTDNIESFTVIMIVV